MKIFTAAQIRTCDAFTIKQQGITSRDLMERAAAKCVEWIIREYSRENPVLVVCGMGNNGGDGLAITRLLLDEGFSARAVILRHAGQFTEDASHNLSLLHKLLPENVQILEPGMFITELPGDILIVDALFGTGLNRPPDGWLKQFIEQINTLQNPKIAIDIPSGLPADTLPLPGSAIIQAEHTLSFQFYKRSFFHKESKIFTGRVHVLDIGLSRSFIENTLTQFHAIDLQSIKEIYRPRPAFAHKGDFGDTLLIGGSYGKIGAIALAARAALRSGAGRVFTHAPHCGYTTLQILNPEAMFVEAGNRFVERIEYKEDDKMAIGIGPGLGTAPETANALLNWLEQARKPAVIDADAINILAEHKHALHLLPPFSVLTPHPKELERLFGYSENSMVQTELARAKAMKYNIYIVLKGHHTALLSPSGECWYNTTGNPGMATGGSGDVLTGLITSLIAQKYAIKEALLLGIYLHGRAGDIAAAECSEEALTASDIAQSTGKAFMELNAGINQRF